MTSDGLSRLERLLDQTARKRSGSSLHPLELLPTVQQVVEEAVQDETAPNDIRVTLSTVDYSQYAPALSHLREEIEALIDGIEQRGNLHRVGDRILRFAPSDDVAQGNPVVSARFADTRHRAQAPFSGVTRRLDREAGVWLLVGGAAVVQVTHTPFTIGRGPGNNLVLPSLAVSREHAELVRSEHGYALVDLGSRNGLSLNGRRLKRVEMAPGVRVKGGDVELEVDTHR